MRGMTMTQRLALLLAAVLLPALLGSLALTIGSVREAYATQLEVRNADAAAALALALSQQRGDLAAMQTVLGAQFDTGHYRALRLRAPDGRALLERLDTLDTSPAPGWFRRGLPIEAPPGLARVTDGWRELGRLEVESRADWAHAALWSAALRTATALLALAVLAAVLAAALLRGWQRPLAAAVAQARALEQGRFVTAAEPGWPELRGVTRSMNAMVARLQQVFEAQARQVALLQRQAQADAVTGLPRREQFLGRLHELLADSGAPPATLLLVRARNLEAVNQRFGHDVTDRLLGALADILQTYVGRVPAAFAGRLGGTDFALCLPAAGVGPETADSVLAALQASPLGRNAGARWAVGAVDGLRGGSMGAALAAADAALAQAEHDPSGAPAVDRVGEFVADPAGARAWREQIAGALAEGRVQIGSFPVRDARGRLLHLECPLRVQLDPGGPFHAARRWLALAARSRLLPDVDLTAVSLALAAIAADGRPRGVHVAAASLLSADFRLQLQRQLDAAPAAAKALWLDLPDELPAAAETAMRETVAGWRACGVRVGVEHAGASAQALTALQDAGLDYVKIDARHLRGIADDPAVADYAQSLLALVRGLGLQALAEGIADPRDLAALWALGFDGATGGAVAADDPPG